MSAISWRQVESVPRRRLRAPRRTLIVALAAVALAGYLAGSAVAHQALFAQASTYQDARAAHLYTPVATTSPQPSFVSALGGPRDAPHHRGPHAKHGDHGGPHHHDNHGD